MKKFLNFPMHTARIPPVELTPAISAAVLEMHSGHIYSSNLGGCGLEHESFELLLQRLGDSRPPSLRDGLGCGIGEDILVTSFQAVPAVSRR